MSIVITLQNTEALGERGTGEISPWVAKGGSLLGRGGYPYALDRSVQPGRKRKREREG